VRHLVAAGHRVSLGHSGATTARASRGPRGPRATHRHPPLQSHAPVPPSRSGPGRAVLDSETVAVESHLRRLSRPPPRAQRRVARKSPSGVMAISDGTAGSGYQRARRRASLGGRPITVHEHAALLGRWALRGAWLTMSGAFRRWSRDGVSRWLRLPTLCATTPAQRLGLIGQGRLAAGMLADLVVLDADSRRAADLGGRTPRVRVRRRVLRRLGSDRATRFVTSCRGDACHGRETCATAWPGV